jgi:hypothetical protein
MYNKSKPKGKAFICCGHRPNCSMNRKTIELIHYVTMMTSSIESKAMIKYIALFAIVCVVIWTGGVADLIVTIPCFPALLPPKPIDKK